MFNRDSLLKDLKNYVIEFTLKDKQCYRLTLRENIMPQDYIETKGIVEEYHNTNTSKIGAWCLRPNIGWKIIDIGDITYTQIIDNY
jgi:hypothetical protein